MTFKKIVLSALMLLAIAFTVLITYSFNTEYFYQEYWIQKSVEETNLFEPEKVAISREIIKYDFYHDDIINIGICFYGDGIIEVTQKQNTKKKVIQLHATIGEFYELKRKFLEQWSKSKSQSVDYKFGGTYYELELQSEDFEGIQIAYYNVVPDSEFDKFREGIFRLINRAMSE